MKPEPNFRALQIGDEVPGPAPRSSAVLLPCDPVWFVMQTMPQGEVKAKAWLSTYGVESWFPTETAWRQVRGQQRKEKYERRIIPGYLFSRFEHEPNWPTIRHSKHKLRVVGVNGSPISVTDEAMSDMQSIPERLREMKQMAIAAKIIKPGDRARIRDGYMRDWVVDVSEVSNGIAKFVLPGGMEAKIEVDRLDKEAPLAW